MCSHASPRFQRVLSAGARGLMTVVIRGLRRPDRPGVSGCAGQSSLWCPDDAGCHLERGRVCGGSGGGRRAHQELCCGMWFTPHSLNLLYVHQNLKLYLAHLLYLTLRSQPDLRRKKALQSRLYSLRLVYFKIDKTLVIHSYVYECIHYLYAG